MKKGVLIGLGFLVGVAILAGAAFLAVRLLMPAKSGSNDPIGSPVGKGSGPMLTTKGGASGPAEKSVRLDIENAEEIPTRAADLNGIITEIKDNSFVISSGGAMSVSMSEDGEMDVQIDPNAPSTEIVVTKETQLYVDTTFAERTPEEGLPAEGEKIQQTVEIIPFSDIEKNNNVMVWGYKRGDRMIAEVILYTKPMMFKRP